MSSAAKTPILKENKMKTMPVGRLLLTMAAPMVMSMLVQALYNIVDSIYVSRISESAVTALSLAFPIQNLQIGFSTGVAVGVNALLSKALGEGDRKKANLAAGNGIFLMGIITIAFIIFGIFGTRPYFSIQSSVEETVNNGTVYSSICCIFTIGIFVEILGERLLQASGRTVYTLFTQGTGAIINIILDPVLIFGWWGMPKMGIAGAATATVIGQCVAAIMAVIFNIKCNPDVQLSLKAIKPQWSTIKPILIVGVPSSIMMVISSIMNFSMNQIFLGFKDIGETAAGVFGIYYKLQSFFFMPMFGLNNAAISIIAFNYGARQPGRITKVLRFALGAALMITVCGLLVFQFAPEFLLGIFNPGENFLSIGIIALRTISFHFPLAAICIILIGSFQAMGNGIYATITSLCRQMVVLVPAAYLLSLTGSVDNVWWAFVMAEAVSVTFTLIFFARLYRKKIRPLSEQ